MIFQPPKLVIIESPYRFSVASIKVTEIFTTHQVGERVNVHVVESVKQPAPDFDAMKRTIQGANSDAKRNASENELVDNTGRLLDPEFCRTNGNVQFVVHGKTWKHVA